VSASQRRAERAGVGGDYRCQGRSPLPGTGAGRPAGLCEGPLRAASVRLREAPSPCWGCRGLSDGGGPQERPGRGGGRCCCPGAGEGRPVHGPCAGERWHPSLWLCRASLRFGAAPGWPPVRDAGSAGPGTRCCPRPRSGAGAGFVMA